MCVCVCVCEKFCSRWHRGAHVVTAWRWPHWWSCALAIALWALARKSTAPSAWCWRGAPVSQPPAPGVTVAGGGVRCGRAAVMSGLAGGVLDGGQQPADYSQPKRLCRPEPGTARGCLGCGTRGPVFAGALETARGCLGCGNRASLFARCAVVAGVAMFVTEPPSGLVFTPPA